MSSGAGGSGWSVELSRDAAREVRAAPPVVRHRLSRLLDQLAGEGVPAEARRVGDGEFVLEVGDTSAVLVVDVGKRWILVAALRGLGRLPVRDALRAAHLPAGLASRVAHVLDELIGDVRISIRGLRRTPVFVLSVLATLSLAVGGTTALFGLADAVFTGALPFAEGDELVRLRDRRVSAGGEPRIFNMSPLDFAAIRDRSTTLVGVAAAGGTSHVLTGGEVAQRVGAIRVSPGWAELLGVRPWLGRLFSEEEERRGPDARVALLSHALWESRFGADPDIVGRQVPYDGGVFTVVGVLQPRFRYPYDADLWMPWRWDPTDGVSHDLNVVGRMSASASIDDVRRDLDRIARTLQEARPDTNTDLFLNVESLRGDFIRDEDQVLLALLAAVAFLLLLACVNVTNLFVARFVGRQREMGVRVALGAGQIRQIRGFMVETVLLFVAGGALGLALSLWLGDALGVLVPDVMRTQLDMAGVAPSIELAGFALGISALAGLIFGYVAALRGSRVDVTRVLKEGGRGASAGTAGAQRALVVTQLALSMALLVGAGVLVDHFRRLSTADLGLDLADLYTLRISVEHERFSESDARLDIVTRLQEAFAALPSVEAVGYTTVNPLCCGDWGAALEVEGHDRPEGTTHLIHHRLVGSGYFAATGTPLLQGRDFDRRDRPGSPPTVIVDRALADRFWPDQDPLGKRVRRDAPGARWRTVVGVVGDVDEAGDYTETWYLPYTQNPLMRSSENLHFMLRASSPDVLAAARDAVRATDPTLAVYEAATMRSLRAEGISQDRIGATAGSVFAIFGLLLAALGVFGMLSYSVSTRRREIGTRIALGAHPARVMGLVLGSAGRITAVGLTAGLALAWAVTRLLRGIVFGLEAAGPLLVAGPALVLLVASGLAAALPALRAARLDPVEALRD